VEPQHCLDVGSTHLQGVTATTQHVSPAAESGLSGKSYEEKLVELGLDTLEERRHQADMVMVHKILNGKGQLDHIYIGLRMPWMAKGPPGMQLTPST
jgi:hypothetical protein